MIDLSQWRASIGSWNFCQRSPRFNLSCSIRSANGCRYHLFSTTAEKKEIKLLKIVAFLVVFELVFLGLFLSIHILQRYSPVHLTGIVGGYFSFQYTAISAKNWLQLEPICFHDNLLLLLLSGDVELNPGPTFDPNILKKEPKNVDLLKIFNGCEHHYELIGHSLEVTVTGISYDPVAPKDSLRLVFDRWRNKNKDVNWEKIMQVCEDFPHEFERVKFKLEEYLSSEKARRKYLDNHKGSSAKQEVINEDHPLVKELLELGYLLKDCLLAAEKCSNLSEAIDFLKTIQMPPLDNNPIEPRLSQLMKIFESSAQHYLLIGFGLGVNVSDLLPLPQMVSSNLVTVFQRWIDSGRDVTWRTVAKMCEDFPDQLGNANAKLKEFLPSLDDGHKHTPGDDAKEAKIEALITPGTMKKWCKEGTVDLTLTRVHMVGPPGSGKTCTQCLLLNEPPPKHNPRPAPSSDSHTSPSHTPTGQVVTGTSSDPTPSLSLSKSITKSTPIACKAVKALRVSIDDDVKLERVSRYELLQRLARSLREKIRDLDKKKGPISGIHVPPQELTSDVSMQKAPKVQIEEKEIEAPVKHEGILKEIADLIPKAKAQLSDKWVYIIDSGGQPAYQELLPLFTRAASLNIVTIDLSKDLDEKVEFTYRINGKEFKCDEKMKYSNRELFKSVVSSVILKKPLNLQYKVTKVPQHSMNFVVGTHYDILIEEFDEKTAEKKVLQMSKELMSPQTLMHYLTKYILSNVHKNSMIVPVDTLLTDPKERTEASKKLLSTISTCPEVSLTVRVPIRCFTFELYLESKAGSKGFLTRKEAVEEGKELYMSETEVDEALVYLHNCTIILYYPEIEPKLVFSDPQKILDVLSHLLALTYVDTESAQSFAMGIEQKEINNLKAEGHFQEALLKKFTKVFSEEFQPGYFINLLKHLHIIVELEYSNGEVWYFLPSALPAYNNSFNTTASVKPLLFVWIEKEENKSPVAVPVPQGIFHLIIVRLLTQKEYEVQFPSHHCKYCNAVTLWIIIKRKRYTLQIIKCSTYIEVYFNGKGYSPQVRELLTTAVNKSSDSISVKHNHVYAFPCPNPSTSDADTNGKCYCIVDDEERIVNCTLCPDSADISEDDSSYWCWFGMDSDSEVVSSGITEDDSLHLTHLHDLRMLLKRSQFSNAKWFDFGLALHLHYNTLMEIDANYPRDMNSCLRECLVKWLERADDVDKHGGANWTTLIQALEDCKQKTPAEHIRHERLKRGKLI